MPERIPPLEPPYRPEAAAVLRRMMPRDEAPLALFRLFARHQHLAEALHGWGSYQLGRRLGLGLRDREIVIDRTCALCGCEYEWGVHIARFAERAGLTADQVDSLTYGTSADGCWTAERDRLLLDATDALHTHHDIDDGLWDRLGAEFTAEQLLDLLMLCGWYHAISFTARATRLAPEPGAPRFRRDPRFPPDDVQDASH
ncbi:carboxymuconolactone decarboxylase family protein [Streptomyces natalensis]|uniref:Carboxymuconolactone decarboxylase n=1 Tax=Streptomyces natalensis ATCC 27448 TaxID=1240678 RepID=A0A0D7CHA5_9ACTN|nr:carboxymuconolactone decarboxylase family protein [Streptomyces natalensis]KIZ15225.1 carboxymuconolactone decarboxylase [Streptomyces natalensis ATCC 27448]